MERLYATYGNEIEFVIVYIREAHPEMLREGNKTGIVGRPQDIDERLILATECVSQFKFTIPMVIDGMNGTVNSDYQAAPVRVTITDLDGKVAYYAGRGPFDFRLSKVEKVLKKLTANGGLMPPMPPPVWGKTVDGLRCGLSIDPPKLTVGKEVTVHLSFENRTDRPINLCFNAAEALKKIVLNNDGGQALKIEPSGGNSWMSRMMRRGGGRMRIRPQTIEEGKSYVAEIDGKVIAGPDSDGAPPGPYTAHLDFEVDEETKSQLQREYKRFAWTGALQSGKVAFDLAMPRQAACLDCHGDSDYHHDKEGDCTQCHVGEPDTEEFGTRLSACARCHPRGEVKGRRQILGPGGEYDLSSVHLTGGTEDKSCLLCHDHGRHQDGEVGLVDPRSGGARLHTGTATDFCLTCHGGKPPAGVSFPDPNGSGYDKSAYTESTVFRGGKGCSDCHASHGSSHPSLLVAENLESPHLVGRK